MSEERLLQLSDLVAYHQKKYHLEDAPEISDEVYDGLVRELEQLEEKYNVPENKRVSNRVGAIG